MRSRKEIDNATGVLIVPRPQSVRQIKHKVAPTRGRQRGSPPAYAARICREHPRDCFEECGLAGAIGADQTEHLAGTHFEGYIPERKLIMIALGQRGNLHEHRGGVWDGLACGRRHCTPFYPLRRNMMKRIMCPLSVRSRLSVIEAGPSFGCKTR